MRIVREFIDAAIFIGAFAVYVIVAWAVFG